MTYQSEWREYVYQSQSIDGMVAVMISSQVWNGKQVIVWFRVAQPRIAP